MIAGKKYLNWLPLAVIFFSGSITAQPDTLITQEETAFFGKQLDSMPGWIASGKLEPNIRPCNLIQHLEFYGRINGQQVSHIVEATKLTGKQRNAYLLLQVLKHKAIHSYDKKDYPAAKRFYQQALVIAIDNDFTYEELHRLRPPLNNVYFFSGDYEMAMGISTEGLATAEKIKDDIQAAHFNNVIGYIHMKQGNFAEASRYFSLYFGHAKKMKDTLTEAHALLNLADLAMAQKQYDNALNFLRNSLSKYESLESSGLFTKADRGSFISNKMGEAYKLKGNYRQALPYVLAAVEVLKKDSGSVNDYDEASYYINAGDIYNHLKLPDSAITYLQKGLAVATLIIHREYMRDAYEQLAIAYSQKKDFQRAFTYQDLFTKIKDSIAEESNQREIYQRETALQLERQQQLQKIAMQRQRTWRNIIIGIAAFFLLTAAFFYSRYRLKQKNRYQKELNRQQNELFNAIAVTQDQERKRIAEDIHDSLGSILSAAKLKLSALKESQTKLSDEQAESWQLTLQLLDEASSELRSISHNIMPATLSKLGLVAAIKNLINNISSHTSIKISFSSHDFENRIAEQAEMSIYRIVLELINNIVKHAQAIKVTIQLIKYPDYINLTVEDNGKGFDYENELQGKKGIGLGNILSRVDYLKGKINVDAAPGRGTTVIIDIPYTA